MLTLDTRTPTGFGVANPELMSVWTLEIQKKVDAFIDGYRTRSVDQQSLLKIGNKISKRVMRIRTDISARIDYIEMGYKLKEPGITADEVLEITEERRNSTTDVKARREWARHRYNRKKELAILRDALDTVKERYNEIDTILDDIPGDPHLLGDDDDDVKPEISPSVVMAMERVETDRFSQLSLTTGQRKCLRVCGNISDKQLWRFFSTLREDEKPVNKERTGFLVSLPLIIHMDIDIVIHGMLRDRDYRYKNIFEVASTKPTANAMRMNRLRWEGALFGGLYDGVTARERVKYGLLHVSDDPNGNEFASRAYGKSYVVLHEHAKDRITITKDDSAKHQEDDPIGLIDSCRHIVDHVFASKEQKEYVDARKFNDVQVNGKKMPGYENRWIEAQIHGDVHFATDVAKLVIDSEWDGNVAFKERLDILFREIGVPIPYEFIRKVI